jgi:hypothetical protein
MAWEPDCQNVSLVFHAIFWAASRSNSGSILSFLGEIPRTGPARATDLARLIIENREWGSIETPAGVLVSVPERAVIEMLSEVGIHPGIKESRNMVEGVRSLRLEVLAMLLQHCKRVKVVRLCVLWAEELNLSWAEAARCGREWKSGKAVGPIDFKTEQRSSWKRDE